MRRLSQVVGALLLLAACKPAAKKLPDFSQFAVTPPAASLHRLSIAQYTNSIHDLLSPSIVVAPELDSDVVIDGFVSVGMTAATISPTGVGLYETSALSIAAQALSTPANKAAFFPCVPASLTDTTCLTTFVTAFGRRAWRRPLVASEVQNIVNAGLQAARQMNDPWQGLGAAMAEILESPYFLFRVELGEPDPAGNGNRYSNYEMASRLAAFLTNSTPDDQLLDAAEAGQLVTDAGLQAQVTRLLASPAAHVGIRNFFTELYQLQGLSQLQQDPTVYVDMNANLGPAAQEETLEDLERIVLDQNADFRTFLTGRTTNINRLLAAVYDVPAPSLTGFAPAELPANGLRAGFFGQVSFLALQAHPTSTSPTLRGKFIRNVLLCETIPPPPVNVNTGLEPVSANVRTMRQRDEEHLLLGGACYGCHSQMDPIGLGFENFDAIGNFRTMDNGEPIDTTGNLDGSNFSTPVDIARIVASHPKFPPCVAQKVFEYATGQQPTSAQANMITQLGSAFVETGYHVKDLMEIIAMSSGFRRAGAPQ
jgi:hypothetical protein